MGKCFIIAGITPADNGEWFHLCLKDTNEQNDIRYLHIEPKGAAGELGAGVEMSPDYSRVYEGPGYVLKEEHSKPMNQWAIGDVVSEQCYPEVFDEREKV